MEITLRPPTRSDRAFVAKSWANGARKYYPHVPRDSYRRGIDRLIDRSFARSDVSLLCDRDDPEQLFGFIVYEQPDRLHWVYVKHPFRREGLARQLLAAAFGDRPITVRWPVNTLGRRVTAWDPFAFED